MKLTHRAALDLVAAGIAKAEAMGVPQVIVVVDEGCNMLAMVRMDGSRVLSIESATRKAMTAAATGLPTGGFAPDIDTKLALATDGRMTNLRGGLPIVVEGQIVGGIGVGSGRSDQDVEVAEAALRAMGLA